MGPLLVILFLASVGWIVFGAPGRWLTVFLILGAAASVGVLAMTFLPEPLTPAQKNALGAAAACATLLVGYLAIPGVRSQEPDVTVSPAATSTQNSSAPSPSLSTTPTELDPLTTNIRFGQRLAPCEGFAVNKKFLRSLTKPKDVTADWAYGNGGATLSGKMILTIQGRTRSAVVVNAIRIVDFEREPAPDHNVEVIPCFPAGGLQTVRYFEIDLDKRPKIIARPSDPIPPDDKIQPAAKFPFKVSRSDPEVFEMWVDGPKCLCTWRLAIDWTNEGRSGTTLVDHGFDKIRMNTTKGLPSYYYDSDAGTWVPPLPK
jgi:hypothetical protein